MNKYVYFDNSALQKIIEKYDDDLNHVLSTNNYRLCISTHNIYEFARCYLKANTIEKGKEIFRVLSSINNPRYILIPDIVIQKEKIRSESAGGYLITKTDELNNTAMKAEIMRLAKSPNEEAKIFIKKREKNITVNYPKISNKNIKELMKIRGDVKTYEDFKKIVQDKICQYYSKYYKLTNISFILSDPKKYGYINTLIAVQIYILWINYRHKKAASRDKIDDYRHLINGSYHLVDIFVTADKKLFKNIYLLNNTITYKTYDDYVKELKS
jgi:hypothetical protein